MLKMKNILTESKYLTRKFGDPLPTLKGVMKQHQESKLEEDWWSDLDQAGQAAYIKAHPQSQKAQDAKKETGDEPSGEPTKELSTKPQSEVNGKKYGQGISSDSEHFFDAVAMGAKEGDSKYNDLMSAAGFDPDEDEYDGYSHNRDGNFEKFKAAVDTLEDDAAREHLQNMINHVEAGTYKDEFPSGIRGIKNAQDEVMDQFRQAATYYDYSDMGRTGNELKGEITINGKQYSPLTESVKKPNYKFAELHDRLINRRI
ncbi:hypothetical protein H8D04_00200 [bacterium]|nr:hypothetical protein [bacterium]